MPELDLKAGTKEHFFLPALQVLSLPTYSAQECLVQHRPKGFTTQDGQALYGTFYFFKKLTSPFNNYPLFKNGRLIFGLLPSSCIWNIWPTLGKGVQFESSQNYKIIIATAIQPDLYVKILCPSADNVRVTGTASPKPQKVLPLHADASLCAGGRMVLWLAETWLSACVASIPGGHQLLL